MGTCPECDETFYIDEKTEKPKRKTLLEIKAEGGYCVAPGSPTKVHETGRPYRHVSGPPITEVPIISAEEQEILTFEFNRIAKIMGMQDAAIKGCKTFKVGDVRCRKVPGGDHHVVKWLVVDFVLGEGYRLAVLQIRRLYRDPGARVGCWSPGEDPGT